MAKCGTVPSNFKLQLQTNGSWFKPQNSYPKNFPRNYRSASLPSWRVSKRSTMSFAVTFITPVFNGSPMRCSCLGTMMDFESAAASSWVPVIDQVLLIASVFFAYMAGVIPSGALTPQLQYKLLILRLRGWKFFR